MNLDELKLREANVYETEKTTSIFTLWNLIILIYLLFREHVLVILLIAFKSYCP